MRFRADDLCEHAVDRGRRAAAALRRRAADGVRALFHGDADRAGAAHRIRNDQLYHYYLGDPLEVLLLRHDGSAARAVVGPDLRSGEQVQLLIPGNTFHTARLRGTGRWFLGASTEWPGVAPADVELGDVEALAAAYPAAAAELRAIADPVRPD
ncbi:MAG TPA: cupin domain-containing protein [Xanthobacteraceae bacterium]